VVVEDVGVVVGAEVGVVVGADVGVVVGAEVVVVFPPPEPPLPIVVVIGPFST
jgi:hypothetical protein